MKQKTSCAIFETAHEVFYFGRLQEHAHQTLNGQVQAKGADYRRCLGLRSGGQTVLDGAEKPGGDGENNAAQNRQFRCLNAIYKAGCKGQQAKGDGRENRDAEIASVCTGCQVMIQQQCDQGDQHQIGNIQLRQDHSGSKGAHQNADQQRCAQNGCQQSIQGIGFVFHSLTSPGGGTGGHICAGDKAHSRIDTLGNGFGGHRGAGDTVNLYRLSGTCIRSAGGRREGIRAVGCNLKAAGSVQVRAFYII